MPFTAESIERATLAAVPPAAVEELPGWLLPLDEGTVGRAHSAVPLTHDAPDLALLPDIEARYRARSLPPVFRLPVDVAAFDAFGAALRERDYVPSRPTMVMTGSAQAMAAGGRGSAAPSAVRLDAQPGDDWARVYLGEGFDPVDGGHRVRLLRRAQDAVYASVRLDAPGRPADAGDVAAVGCACFSQGLVGVHGMRTRPRFRGLGLARQLMAAMGAEALRRGIAGAFLQVELENYLARSLYARIGFAPAWTYVYWQQPAVR
ncbi:MAG: GNAT family N-acetyltransferase [Xenophilus sp.]